MQVRYQVNRHTGIFIWMFLFILFLFSTIAEAQVDETEDAEPQKELFLGYSIALGSQVYELSSNLTKLDGLRVRREGGSVGLFIGSETMALKPTVGLFYASPTVAYSVDALEFGLAGCSYFLRAITKKHRSIEPYLSIASKEVRSTFYGHFLDGYTGKNKSVSRDEKFGRLSSLQGFVGVGAEYQLRSLENHFLHFFVEARYGVTMRENASTSLLSSSHTREAASFAIGVNFGRIRNSASSKI